MAVLSAVRIVCCLLCCVGLPLFCRLAGARRHGLRTDWLMPWVKKPFGTRKENAQRKIPEQHTRKTTPKQSPLFGGRWSKQDLLFERRAGSHRTYCLKEGAPKRIYCLSTGRDPKQDHTFWSGTSWVPFWGSFLIFDTPQNHPRTHPSNTETHKTTKTMQTTKWTPTTQKWWPANHKNSLWNGSKTDSS